MDRIVRDFAAEAQDAEIALFYFSGHGVQIDGTNYLIPIDVGPSISPATVDFRTLNVDVVLRAMEGADARVKIVLLDACRRNPFAAPTAQGRGLAQMQPPPGTVIGFAAQPDTTAFEGPVGGNSPYAKALATYMEVRSLELFTMLSEVGAFVMSATNNRQQPWLTVSLPRTQRVSLDHIAERRPASEKPLAKVTTSKPAVDEDATRRDYEFAERIGSVAAIDAFLETHSTGFFVALAKAYRAKLTEASNRGFVDATPLRPAPDRELLELMGQGKQYALVIGNANYQDSQYATLKTPHADARAVANILVSRYGFTTQFLAKGDKRNLLLLDAKAGDIYDLLDELAENLHKQDRLLIYYACHGLYETETGTAYWVPVNARFGRTFELIPALNINNAAKRIVARSVLVVSDSCYSGALFRDAPTRKAFPSPAEREVAILKLAAMTSRVFIASGGKEPVLDGGGSGHSIFARELLKALSDPEYSMFSASDLYSRLQKSVLSNATQVPQYGPLQNAGDNEGDFVFLTTRR
jgi:uncharacterized caspase-like protein